MNALNSTCSTCKKVTKLEIVRQIILITDEHGRPREDRIVYHNLCARCEHKFLYL